MSPVPETWHTWIARAGAFFVAGAVGGELAFRTTRLTNRISLDASARFPLVVTTGIVIVLVVTPLWWLVLRDGRTGPAWGALVAASAPVFVTVTLAIAAILLGTQSPGEMIYSAALFQLLVVPATVILAVVGGLLESERSPVGSD